MRSRIWLPQCYHSVYAFFKWKLLWIIPHTGIRGSCLVLNIPCAWPADSIGSWPHLTWWPTTPHPILMPLVHSSCPWQSFSSLEKHIDAFRSMKQSHHLFVLEFYGYNSLEPLWNKQDSFDLMGPQRKEGRRATHWGGLCAWKGRIWLGCFDTTGLRQDAMHVMLWLTFS